MLLSECVLLCVSCCVCCCVCCCLCVALCVQHPALNPEVEAALKQLLASPEVKAQFHDPAVHAALQEVRGALTGDCTTPWLGGHGSRPPQLLCTL